MYCKLCIVFETYVKIVVFNSTLPPRFGKALAKNRSLHAGDIQQKALEFLAAAAESSNQLDTRPRINNKWMRSANLKPVIEYLSNK